MKAKKTLIAIFASALALGACTDFDNGFDARTAKYQNEFEKEFGTVDPNQDWSMATRSTANFNLSGMKGNAIVNVFNGNPNASRSAKILGSATINNGIGSFNFYSIKGVDNVYVQVKQDGKTTLTKQCTLENGNIYVGEFATRAFTDDACPTTQRTDENATRDYTFFNNTVSTTILGGIKYPSTDGYQNENNTKSREGWVTATKNENRVSWNSYDKVLTNNSPFTDESVCQFLKVTGSDFTSLTVGSMKSDVSTSSVTETMITWNGSKKTFEGWKQAVLDAYGSNPSNYQYNNTNYPFTVESILVSKTENYVTTFSFDWSNVKYKTGAIISEPGDVYTYNGTTNSLSAWQTDAANHVNEILASTYNGPWSNATLKACITTTKCSKDTEGAIYGGLTDDATWVFKSNTTQLYANVCPTFQYLNNVEKSAAPGWNLATGYSFFGDGNFFAESVSVWDGRKLGTYYDTETMKKMEQGFSITTTENQVIELPFVFGVTAYTNQFGYIYYKESKEAEIDPIALKHYVLIEDGRPSRNIYRDTWQTGTAVKGDDHGSLADWNYTYPYTTPAGETVNVNFNGTYGAKGDDIVCYCSKEASSGIYGPDETHLADCYSPADQYALVAGKSIIGTTYRPMFFGEDGNATTGTYKWPAGYKIIFWINSLATSKAEERDELVANHPEGCFSKDGLDDGKMGGHFNYSIPSLNHRLYHEYQGTIKDGKDEDTFGQVQTISWTIQNSDNTSTTFLAFGDASGDKDLNDMVFMVKGATPDERTVVVGPVKWHLNYNQALDLTDGDLFDFYSLNIGASYTNPKNGEANSEPQRPGYEFIGWSTEPKATTGVKDIADIVHDEKGAQYFAIWRGVGESTVQSWIFACEDLGGSYDYDFNDIIWEISQESVENEDNTVTYQPVKVKLLASGGQLPVKLIYGTQIVGENELHEAAYNGTASENGKYTQVNVYSDVALVEPAATWELEGTSGKAMDIDEIKSKIKIWVDGSVIDADDYYVTQVRVGDKTDKAPQILILPGDWCWPTEGTNIKETYNNFEKWVQNTKAADWYHYRVAGKFIQRFK